MSVPPSVGPEEGVIEPNGVSGQVSTTAPWNDPLGFTDGGETSFLFCAEEHTRYSPLCRRDDLGATPAQIVANAIQQREWDYQLFNYRLSNKYFSTADYAVGVVNSSNELRRFASLWLFDWSSGQLAASLAEVIGPDNRVQVASDFATDISTANQLAVAYQRAIIDQSAAQRPYATSFDPYFGNVTQQGIQVDKIQGVFSLSSLWSAGSDFDPSQAAGTYVSTLGNQFGDAPYTALSTSSLADLLGANFASWPYLQLAPLFVFPASTYSAQYAGDPRLQGWVSGQAFSGDQAFLDYVHAIAVQHGFLNCDAYGNNCDPCISLAHCNWDPRTPAVIPTQLTQSDPWNQFVAPDGHTYIWDYLQNRSQWILTDQGQNPATYQLMLGLNQALAGVQDAGTATVFESDVNAAVSSFTYLGGQSQ